MKSLFSKLMVLTCLALPALGAAGCSNSDGGTDSTTGKTISELTINGDNTVDAKASKQLSATLKYADGTTLDVTQDSHVLWNTSDADVLEVTKSGLITGKKVGAAKISLSYDNGGHADDTLDVIIH